MKTVLNTHIPFLFIATESDQECHEIDFLWHNLWEAVTTTYHSRYYIYHELRKTYCVQKKARDAGRVEAEAKDVGCRVIAGRGEKRSEIWLER